MHIYFAREEKFPEFFTLIGHSIITYYNKLSLELSKGLKQVSVGAFQYTN